MPPWLTDSVLVAIVGLIGVVVGHVVGGVTQYKTARLAHLEGRVDELEEKVKRYEAERDTAVSAAREAERLLWHMGEYARKVLSWARDLLGLIPPGVEVPAEPAVPDEIREKL